MRRWRLKLPEHLPDLKGKWLTLYTIIWAIMLLLAIVGPARFCYAFYGYQSKPAWIAYGLQLLTVGDDLRVMTGLTAEARSAGMKPGELLLAIDDWKVPRSPTSLTDARVHLFKPEGSTTVFKFVGEDGAVREIKLTYSRRHIDEVFRGTGLSLGGAVAITIGGTMMNCLGLVAAAVLLFIRQRRQAVPAFLSLGFLIASAAAFAAQWSDLGISYSIVNFVAAIGFCLLFAALFALPDGRLSPRWTRVAVLALPMFLIASVADETGNALTMATLIFCVLAIMALVGRYRSLPAGPARQQMRWVFLGFVAGIVLGMLNLVGIVVTDWLLPADSRWYAWGYIPPFLGNIGSLVIAAGLMISILKYRLYDADAVIGRSAAFGVLTLGFLALFAGSEKLVELIGEKYFEHSIGMAAGAIGAAVAAVCIVPLHNRIHRWAERRFQKPLIRLREGLPGAVADLRESAPVDQLVSAVMCRVEAGVHSTREAVLLASAGGFEIVGTRGVAERDVREWQSGWQPNSGEHPLDCRRDDPRFPLRVRLSIETGDEPETVGWLLLGPRPDGSFFGKDERETLELVAGPIARAIHIAQLREEREQRQQEQNARAETRLRAIERQLQSVLKRFGKGPGDGMPAAS